MPGRSNAFAISKRLGIEDSIIQRAKELVSAENTKFEDVVRSLEETRQKLEEEKAQAEALRLQAVKLNESAQEQKKLKLRAVKLPIWLLVLARKLTR